MGIFVLLAIRLAGFESPRGIEALNESGTSLEEFRSTTHEMKIWLVAYVLNRALLLACLVGIILGNRVFIWLLCAATISMFMVNLWGGENTFSAIIDLAGFLLFFALWRRNEALTLTGTELNREFTRTDANQAQKNIS